MNINLKGKKKIILIIAAIIIIGGGYFLLKSKQSKTEYTTEKVKIGALLQTVSETGAVKSASEIDLNFLNAGQISNISVKVGDKVKKDQLLAELNYEGLSIKEKEATANLNIAQANLNKLLSGAAKEDISVAQARVNESQNLFLSSIKELDRVKNVVSENISQAEKTLNDLELKTSFDVTTYEKSLEIAQNNLEIAVSTYKQFLENKKSSAIVSIESQISAVNTALDAVSGVITNDDSKDVLSIKKPEYLANTKTSYSDAIILKNSAAITLSAARSDKTDGNIDKAFSDIYASLNKVKETLGLCFNSLENTITSSSFSQTELDSAKSIINAQTSNINSAISSVQTADNNLDDARLAYNTNVSSAEKNLTQAQTNLDNAILTARNSLKSLKNSGDQQITIAQSKVDAAQKSWEAAKANLSKVKAPARKEDIALSNAQLKQAEASMESVKNQIEQSKIIAPIDGTITKSNYEVGEQSTGKGAVISMLGVNNFDIESLISESDIAKVNLNDAAEITLDSFGNDIKFPGKVYFIEPAETELQDVVYYKVKIDFNPDSDSYKEHKLNIKSGMTANITIKTLEKNNILIAPIRGIVSKNGEGKFAKVLINGKPTEVPVKIGTLGDEGRVEVLSGLNEGDEIITFTKTK